MRVAYAAFAGFVIGLLSGYFHAKREAAADVARVTTLFERQRENNRQATLILADAWERITHEDTRALVNRASTLIAIHPDVKLPR